MQRQSHLGLQSTLRTVVDRHAGSLTADVDPVEASLWVVVLASLTLDLYTTHLGLAAGLAEGNPVMRWAVDGFGFVALALAKLAVLALAGAVREVRPRYGTVIALGVAVPWLLAVLVNAVTLAAL